MDLHVYRNSQDRWHDLRSVARECGAVLALNAVTLDELVGRLTPDAKTASPGQRLAVLGTTPALRATPPNLGGDSVIPTPLLSQEGAEPKARRGGSLTSPATPMTQSTS